MKIELSDLDPDIYGAVWKVTDAFSQKELQQMQQTIDDYPCSLENRGSTSQMGTVETNLGDHLLRKWQNFVVESRNYAKLNMDSMIGYGIHPFRSPDTVKEFVQGTAVGVDYPPHEDSASKLLTCVIYIQPEEHIGTVFHGKDGDKPVEFDWEPNTGYIFISSDKSLHSYHNDLETNRYIYMCNLHSSYVDECHANGGPPQ